MMSRSLRFFVVAAGFSFATARATEEVEVFDAEFELP